MNKKKTDSSDSDNLSGYSFNGNNNITKKKMIK